MLFNQIIIRNNKYLFNEKKIGNKLMIFNFLFIYSLNRKFCFWNEFTSLHKN